MCRAPVEPHAPKANKCRLRPHSPRGPGGAGNLRGDELTVDQSEGSATLLLSIPLLWLSEALTIDDNAGSDLQGCFHGPPHGRSGDVVRHK
jgi:hypothetical protein